MFRIIFGSAGSSLNPRENALPDTSSTTPKNMILTALSLPSRKVERGNPRLQERVFIADSGRAGQPGVGVGTKPWARQNSTGVLTTRHFRAKLRYRREFSLPYTGLWPNVQRRTRIP